MPSIGTQTDPSISMGVGAGSGAQGGLASGSGLGRSAKSRGKQPERADRYEPKLPARGFKTGRVHARWSPTPRPVGPGKSPTLHFHVGSIQMNVPQDPEVLAREAKRKELELKQAADDAAALKATGIKGLWLKTRRFARNWGGFLAMPLYYLLDHLGLGLNLNNLCANILGLFSKAA